MTTITISRQLGSLGTEIAQTVAQRQGYRLVWRDLINQAARQAGAPEVALAAIDDLGLLGLTPSAEAMDAYHQAVRQIMGQLADEGCVVIVGRAGQVVLAGRPDVLHVRIIAPADQRAQRLAQSQGVALAAAQAQVRASDRSRRAYLRRHYRVAWDDAQLYDLVINTAKLPLEAAADLVCRALKGKVAP